MNDFKIKGSLIVFFIIIRLKGIFKDLIILVKWILIKETLLLK